MHQDEIEKVLSSDVAQGLLKEKGLARLAFTARDGTPRAIPIGFFWNGSAIVMCTSTNAAKVRALRERPEVALTIDTEAFPPHVLLLRGVAELEWVDGIPDEYLRMNEPDMMTPEQREGWLAGVRSTYDAMYRIRVKPTWAKALDFETTLPDAIQELLARQGSGTASPNQAEPAG